MSTKQPRRIGPGVVLPPTAVSATESTSAGVDSAPDSQLVEASRIAAVRRYDILDTPPDGAFDRITKLAARLFDVPISIVSIVDSDRIWFKSHHGIDAQQVERSPGLCASAILHDDVYLITDATSDPRTLANPLVAGEAGFRFYAAQPLTTAEGHNLGTLCVIDHKPRLITTDEIELLQTLGGIVMDELELRRSARTLHTIEAERSRGSRDEAARLQTMADTLQVGLESSRQIGRAVGLLMAHYDIDAEAAFEKLRGHSQDLNMKVNTIADGIVGHHNSRDRTNPGRSDIRP